MRILHINFTKYFNDMLYKNSYFLIGSNLINYTAGFVFWVFASRFYSVSQVGIGSALLTISWLIGLFSLLGFDIGIIRFLPEETNKRQIINSCFTISTIIAVIISVVFIFVFYNLSSAMSLIKDNDLFIVIFIIFTISYVLTLLQYSVFIGFREAKYSLIQNIISIVKVLLLPLMVIFGTIGIFLSVGLSYIFTVVIGIILIKKIYPQYQLMPTINLRIIKNIYNYSFVNYIANTLINIPGYLLTILVVMLLGAESNAFFYIAWATANIIMIIPTAISRSLLAEGAFSPQSINANMVKSLKLNFMLLIPVVLLSLVVGRYFLLLFGNEYAIHSFYLLLFLLLACIPYSINEICATYYKIMKNITPVIMIYGAITILTFIMSYFFIQSIGLMGIGISWLISNTLVCIVLILKGDIKLDRFRKICTIINKIAVVTFFL